MADRSTSRQRRKSSPSEGGTTCNFLFPRAAATTIHSSARAMTYWKTFARVSFRVKQPSNSIALGSECDVSEERWMVSDAPWFDQRMTYCVLRGRVIPERIWQAEIGGRIVRFCESACEELYRSYLTGNTDKRVSPAPS